MPFHQALIQNPADAEARQKWDDGLNMLKEFNKQNGYPSTWVLDDPVPAKSQAHDQPEVTSDETNQEVPAATAAPAATVSPTAINYPLTIEVSATGELIIAYRQVAKFGTIPGHRCVVEEKSPEGKPIYVVRTPYNGRDCRARALDFG